MANPCIECVEFSGNKEKGSKACIAIAGDTDELMNCSSFETILNSKAIDDIVASLENEINSNLKTNKKKEKIKKGVVVEAAPVEIPAPVIKNKRGRKKTVKTTEVEQPTQIDVQVIEQKDSFPTPTEEDINNPLFGVIWNLIKEWVITIDNISSPANGGHVKLILDEIIKYYSTKVIDTPVNNAIVVDKALVTKSLQILIDLIKES